MGYVATWLPAVQVRLGDVGLLRGHSYQRVASATDFGLTFTTRTSPARTSFEHLTANEVSFRPQADATVPGALGALADVGARFDVEFRSAGAILFRLGESRISEIEDRHSVGERITQLHGSGDWPDDHVLVTEVVESDATTVLISSASGATATFRANAAVGLGPASLVDAGAGLALVNSSQIGTQIVAESGLTPLFRCFGFRRRIVGRARFGPLRTPETLADVDYDDYD